MVAHQADLVRRSPGPHRAPHRGLRQIRASGERRPPGSGMVAADPRRSPRLRRARVPRCDRDRRRGRAQRPGAESPGDRSRAWAEWRECLAPASPVSQPCDQVSRDIFPSSGMTNPMSQPTMLTTIEASTVSQKNPSEVRPRSQIPGEPHGELEDQGVDHEEEESEGQCDDGEAEQPQDRLDEGIGQPHDHGGDQELPPRPGEVEAVDQPLGHPEGGRRSQEAQQDRHAVNLSREGGRCRQVRRSAAWSRVGQSCIRSSAALPTTNQTACTGTSPRL